MNKKKSNWIEGVFPDNGNYTLACGETWCKTHEFEKESSLIRNMVVYSKKLLSKKGGWEKGGAWMEVTLVCYVPTRYEDASLLGWKAGVSYGIGKDVLFDNNKEEKTSHEDILEAFNDCKTFIMKGVKLVKDFDEGKVEAKKAVTTAK